MTVWSRNHLLPGLVGMTSSGVSRIVNAKMLTPYMRQ